MQISATLESVLAGIFTLFVTEPKGNCHINDAQSTGLETDLNHTGPFCNAAAICYHWQRLFVNSNRKDIFFLKVHFQYTLVEYNSFPTGTQCFSTQNLIM